MATYLGCPPARPDPLGDPLGCGACAMAIGCGGCAVGDDAPDDGPDLSTPPLALAAGALAGVLIARHLSRGKRRGRGGRKTAPRRRGRLGASVLGAAVGALAVHLGTGAVKVGHTAGQAAADAIDDAA